VTRVDRHLTEPEALAELRRNRQHRDAHVQVRDHVEHALELLAVDAVDDAVDVVSDVLRLLEAEG
jgi:hypothetical protein